MFKWNRWRGTAWGSLLLLLLGSGCAIDPHRNHSGAYRTTVAGTPGAQLPKDHQMVFHYATRGGHAALEGEQVVLVFHGLTADQQRLFHFQGNQAGVQIAGAGISSVTVTCSTPRGSAAFQSVYANGTNTLQLGEQAVRITQGGQLLVAGDQAVDLSTGRKIVHVNHGKLRVE